MFSVLQRPIFHRLLVANNGNDEFIRILLNDTEVLAIAVINEAAFPPLLEASFSTSKFSRTCLLSECMSFGRWETCFTLAWKYLFPSPTSFSISRSACAPKMLRQAAVAVRILLQNLQDQQIQKLLALQSIGIHTLTSSHLNVDTFDAIYVDACYFLSGKVFC